MLKTVVLIKRRPDLTPAQFLTHWREHAKLAAALPNMRRYLQNHVEPDLLPGLSQFDGVAESWWDDAEAIRGLRGSAALRAMRDDEPNFIDPSATQTLVVREYEPFRLS